MILWEAYKSPTNRNEGWWHGFALKLLFFLQEQTLVRNTSLANASTHCILTRLECEFRQPDMFSPSLKNKNLISGSVAWIHIHSPENILERREKNRIYTMQTHIIICNTIVTKHVVNLQFWVVIVCIRRLITAAPSCWSPLSSALFFNN